MHKLYSTLPCFHFGYLVTHIVSIGFISLSTSEVMLSIGIEATVAEPIVYIHE